MNSSEETKICSKCRQPRLITDFYLDRHRNRRRLDCRLCKMAKSIRWAKENPEKRIAHKKKWLAAKFPINSTRKPRVRISTEAKKARRKDRQKRYYQDHKEQRKAYSQKWRDENRKYHCESQVARYRDNPEQYKANGRTRRARMCSIPGSHTSEEWLSLCSSFDDRCVCCGEHKVLTRDHVVPVSNPNSSDFICNIQPLCKSCNSSKGNHHTVDYRSTPFTRTGQALLFA